MSGDEEAEERLVVATREFAAAAAAVIGAGFAVKVLFPGPAPTGSAFVMSCVCGAVVALLTDWRSQLGVAILAMTYFAGFVADGARSVGGAGPWSYTPAIGLAAMLGGGYRLLNRASRDSTSRYEDERGF